VCHLSVLTVGKYEKPRSHSHVWVHQLCYGLAVVAEGMVVIVAGTVEEFQMVLEGQMERNEVREFPKEQETLFCSLGQSYHPPSLSPVQKMEGNQTRYEEEGEVQNQV